MAPGPRPSTVGGATNLSKAHVIDLEKPPEKSRLQCLTFKAARKALKELGGQFTGRREYWVVQVIRLVEQFLASDRLLIPSLYHQEPLRRRILYSLNIDLMVQGEDSEQYRAKQAALDAWVSAVNAKGGFGTWCQDVVFDPAQTLDRLAQHGGK